MSIYQSYKKASPLSKVKVQTMDIRGIYGNPWNIKISLQIIPLSQIIPVFFFETDCIIIIIIFWTMDAWPCILLWSLFTSVVILAPDPYFKKIYSFESVSVYQITLWVESEWVVANIQPLKWFLYLQHFQDQTFDK